MLDPGVPLAMSPSFLDFLPKFPDILVALTSDLSTQDCCVVCVTTALGCLRRAWEESQVGWFPYLMGHAPKVLFGFFLGGVGGEFHVLSHFSINAFK